MEIFLSALQQSFFFLPLTLGVFLSYRILAVTDLTVDGTFVLGAATFSRLITNGVNQYISILLAISFGAIIGMLVALMQKIAKINSLIASILAVFMLYSINFTIMGQPNISLLEKDTVLGNLQTSHETTLFIAMLALTLFLFFSIHYFLHSKIGLLLRAYGSNTSLLRNLGQSSLLFLIIGLAISNSLAAFCGAISAQINGYADLNMGLGMALTAIGAVVIGNNLISRIIFSYSKFNTCIECIGCLLGTFLYFLIMNFLLYLGVNPINLKLLLGLALVGFLGTAQYTQKEGSHE